MLIHSGIPVGGEPQATRAKPGFLRPAASRPSLLGTSVPRCRRNVDGGAPPSPRSANRVGWGTAGRSDAVGGEHRRTVRARTRDRWFSYRLLRLALPSKG